MYLRKYAAKFLLALTTGTLSCQALAQTQSSLNGAACLQYKTIDMELDKIYKKILIEKHGDLRFVTALKKAQRAWLIFREAEIRSIYPHKDKQSYYGSAYTMCNCYALADLTSQRVEQLKAWLNPEEGNVCNGSKEP